MDTLHTTLRLYLCLLASSWTGISHTACHVNMGELYRLLIPLVSCLLVFPVLVASVSFIVLVCTHHASPGFSCPASSSHVIFVYAFRWLYQFLLEPLGP